MLISLLKNMDTIKIHPFDDIDVVYGQGTLIMEMLEEFPEIDTLLIPVGGGLLSGCSIKWQKVLKKI